MLSLFWITLFKLGVRFAYMEKRIEHLVPFNGSLFTGSEIDSSEIMLNVFIFVPLGIYTGLLYKK
jgi:glycopeptide antibiotics resistance protein